VSYRYRCRVRACQTRKTLPRRLEDYKLERNVPRCPNCGSELRRDHNKDREAKRKTCLCGELPFPHRRGSKWCRHYTGEYTDQDYEDRRYAYQ